MKEKIIKYLQKVSKDKERLTNQLRTWVQDESIPLDERWEVFCLSKMGDESSFIVHFDSLRAIKSKGLDEYNRTRSLEDYIYHNYVDRYQEIDADALYEWLVEIFTEVDENEDFTVTEQDLIDFKREVLGKFIYNFKMDW